VVGYSPRKELTKMVEVKSKQRERIEKKQGDQIGPDESSKLKRNSKK